MVDDDITIRGKMLAGFSSGTMSPRRAFITFCVNTQRKRMVATTSSCPAKDAVVVAFSRMYCKCSE